jgi:hypothetical protein
MDARVQQLERHTRALVPSFRQVQDGTTNRSGCSMGHDATSSGSTRTLPRIVLRRARTASDCGHPGRLEENPISASMSGDRRL